MRLLRYPIPDLLVLATFVVCVLLFAWPSSASHRKSPTVCTPHGSTKSVAVEMCVRHLGYERCRLTFRWRYSDSMIVHSVGGIVSCGRAIAADPGDRRPR